MDSSGSNQIWATTSGKKDTATSEVTLSTYLATRLNTTAMYIATRHAHLEPREAGFLVSNKLEQLEVELEKNIGI